MKTFLASLIALAVLTFSASAQFVQGPAKFTAFTNPTSGSLVFKLNGGPGLTNVATGCAKIIPVGSSGFGVFLNQASTNTLATTNGTVIQFEVSADGTTFATNLVSVGFVPLGSAYAPVYTNFPSTVGNVGNISAIRVKNIVNTNSETLWITNLLITTR